LSRTQQPVSPSDQRMRTRLHGATRRAPLAPERRDTETLGSGTRYSWGRRGDAFYVWDKRAPGESRGHSSEAAARREFRWLEQETKIKRKRRLVHILLGAGLVSVAAAPALIVMLADGSEEPSPTVSERDAGSAVDARVDSSERLTNDEGGYGFRVPDGWTAETSRSFSQVSDPSGQATISVLVAPEGDIDAVSDTSLATTTADWTDVQAEAPQDRAVGEFPAVSVGGTATDTSGEPIRFLSIVIDSGERNHAIWVSVPETGGASTFLPAIEQILGSFKPLETAA
jgi:hypothetical protein